MFIKVQSFILPLSFTLVNDSNNLLVIDDAEYRLTNGNYNATSLLQHIRELINDDIGVEFNNTTLKYTFSRMSGEFTLNKETTCWELIGFTDTQEDRLSSFGVLTSDSVVNFSGQNQVYIQMPNLATSNLDSETGGRSSIIKSIPIDATNGSVLVWENGTNSTGTQVQNSVISFFHVRLLGEDFKTIDLNSQHWNMTLEVTFESPQLMYASKNQINFQDMINEYVQKKQK